MSNLAVLKLKQPKGFDAEDLKDLNPPYAITFLGKIEQQCM